MDMEPSETLGTDSLGCGLSADGMEQAELEIFAPTEEVLAEPDDMAALSKVEDMEEEATESPQYYCLRTAVQPDGSSTAGTLTAVSPAVLIQKEGTVSLDALQATLNLAQQTNPQQPVKYHLLYNPGTKTLNLITTPVVTLTSSSREEDDSLDHVEGQSMDMAQLQAGELKEPDADLVEQEVSTNPEDFTTALEPGHTDTTVDQLDNGHQRGRYLFQCNEPGCDRTFTTLGYMTVHRLVHMNDNDSQKALTCTFEGCERKFAWPAHLKYHQLTHTGERMYECRLEGCGRRFLTAQHLNVHLRTHTGEKPFVCDVEDCRKSFTTAGNLKNHQRIHTGERPFQCGLEGCSRAFAEQSSLRKHSLTHSKRKPFACECCGKMFSQSGSRNVHMKRHNSVKNRNMVSGGPPPSQTSSLVVKMAAHNMLVLGQQEEFTLEDLPAAGNVVYSNAVTDHVVTVTTQPADDTAEQLSQDISHNVADCLGSPGCEVGENVNVLTVHANTNVVGLAQSDDVVSISEHYENHTETAEEMVDPLLAPELDHEEIAGSIATHTLCIAHELPLDTTRGEENERLWASCQYRTRESYNYYQPEHV